jgi:hypothetical protein
MSEETENDGSWGGLKKTIVGTLATIVTGSGVWISTTLFGGGDDKEETKTEQVAPAPVINLNLENNNTQQQNNSGGGTTIIKERVIEKQPENNKSSTPPKKKEGDEFKETPPAW